jgi:hypothetical protein
MVSAPRLLIDVGMSLARDGEGSWRRILAAVDAPRRDRASLAVRDTAHLILASVVSRRERVTFATPSSACPLCQEGTARPGALPPASATSCHVRPLRALAG